MTPATRSRSTPSLLRARTAPRGLACRYEAPTLALKGGDLHDLELREDDENTTQVTRAALDVVAVLAAAAHTGLKERQGLECLALPVETDAQLCSLVADACRRGDVSLEPCAHVAAAAPPETPARTDLWAAVFARAAKDDADLLPSLSSRLAGTGPDDVARVHLKALEAETLDQVTAKALAKSLVKAAATRADRADALHALLHAGVDAALADAPSTLILLGALRPYVDAAQPKRRGKDAEADAKVDRALVASVRDACAARLGDPPRRRRRRELGFTRWLEGALGTHAPAKKKAPPAQEEEAPGTRPPNHPSCPRPRARRAAARRPRAAARSAPARRASASPSRRSPRRATRTPTTAARRSCSAARRTTCPTTFWPCRRSRTTTRRVRPQAQAAPAFADPERARRRERREPAEPSPKKKKTPAAAAEAPVAGASPPSSQLPFPPLPRRLRPRLRSPSPATASSRG